ncbi:hypothetical protein B0T25DRAFT_146632 [Lasiosphaeria hispida]|uniref:Uncharacterized protein n=1 Tax=Lasiosphaeria hispida TaxID=260671 RepID=A0AAJ0HLI1_9PEZI|nr:hypothetical protein B0T25DRAFT_146632 [Lasiosphaeria hispida]
MYSPRSFLVSRQSQRYNQTHLSSASSSLRSSPSTSPSTSSLYSLSTESVPAKPNDDCSAEGPATSSSSSSDIIVSAMPTKRREMDARSTTLSPPRTTTIVTRPVTPSTPVQIPTRPKSREVAHAPNAHRHHGDRRRHISSRRSQDMHSPDVIPASVAALLAITSIPPPRSSRSMRQSKTAMEKRMTVESIIERSQESEKELSLTLSRGPLDLLLTPPEDLEDDDLSLCDSALGSVLSTRTVSLESMPSLSESFSTDTVSSLETTHMPARRRKARPTRRSLEPVSSPPGKFPDHPLSAPAIVVEVEDLGLGFGVFDESKIELECEQASRQPLKPLKSAFKSNLTASLRALRSAARSFSNLNFPSIPPDDFLTRSILTLDPQVPYTDERRPQLEEEPTAELRRYLNPTTSIRLEQQPVAAATTRTFTASIQMQTYKVHRGRGSSSTTGRAPYPSVGPSAASQSPQGSPPKTAVTEHSMPGPRQREMRENSDFIRIAVMEMAMRKRGKLDDQRSGRARWALPPRKISTTPYVIGSDGVPARWVAVTH